MPAAVPHYVGRFAPSPTGRLHLGSLVAALGSALEAHRHGGEWLLRMDDLDAARVVAGASDDILRTLERLGFAWQRPVVYQRTRIARYREAARQLAERGTLYRCSCSRAVREATPDRPAYPGTCRGGPTRSGPTAVRFRIDESATESFVDRVQGECALPLERLGDVVIQRRDGVFAYQLAVVVDDHDQGVTDVVRGADLLESSGWQRALQRALGLPGVSYAHLPMVLERDGRKLAKSRHSLPVDALEDSAALVQALELLGQSPPRALANERVAAVWDWATRHWSIASLAGRRETRI
jgi:glutamyl-Q tRNA(Asp) synthetase